MDIIRTNRFKHSVKKYKKYKKIIRRLQKQIEKIIQEPERADLLMGDRKGERKVYIPPFRLLYSYSKKEDILYLLDFDHRDVIYKKKRDHKPIY